MYINAGLYADILCTNTEDMLIQAEIPALRLRLSVIERGRPREGVVKPDIVMWTPGTHTFPLVMRDAWGRSPRGKAGMSAAEEEVQ